MLRMPRVVAMTLLWVIVAAGCAHHPPTVDGPREVPRIPGWWRGNTHTHTWWSDGDSPPESVAAWYRQRGYHFLVLSDHNRMQEGQLWYPVDTDAKRAAYARYATEFGADWVESRERNGITEVKLKSLDEFRTLFEEQERFIFIRGMELTDRLDAHPVHLNGVNLERSIVPQGGASVAEVLQKNVDAVAEQGRRTGRPMFSHVNHPNFFYAVTAEDLVALDHSAGDGFVEVFNGHSGVRNHGDADHVGMERMWDIVLARRLAERGASVMYGVANDDAHEYTQWGLGRTNPGRGWVMVRAPRLTPDTITAAMKRGDFYNSTGVHLERLSIEGRTLELAVLPEPGVSYTIEFIGTRRGVDLAGRAAPELPGGAEGRQSLRYDARIGATLLRVSGTSARYVANGDEIYVRARVTSSRLHPNPHAAGDHEMAWTQPLVVSQ